MYYRVRRVMRVCACLCLVFSGQLIAGDDSTIGITGDPPTAVMAGRVYDFAPHAFIVSALSSYFEIENLPPWATFDRYRGELTGSPTALDEGWYPDIRICLSDEVQRACLTSFSITVSPMPAVKRHATLSWIPPEENEDGSSLTDLVCYLIYSGRSPQELLPIVSVPLFSGTSYTFENLPDGEHFFAVTALSILGGESALSEMVSTQIN
jgi:hypothetical protein